ncbi:hypothetical protein [Legionella adelaidensis]|uniref:hypothetical protein n=1 Tax=Legionella adelaidensis TaxID=45056 RepID=UPI000ADD55D2|nr:hypothetical protein [Legionella adelaidensis]
MALKKGLLLKDINQPWNNSFYSTIAICLLASLTASLIIYSIFYHYAETIWSFYTPVDLKLITPYLRHWVMHDGIETYAMYVLVFICILLSSFLYFICNYFLKKYKNIHPYLLILFLFLLLICTALFFFHVGFPSSYQRNCCL